MSSCHGDQNHRILVIDDNQSIHEDFRKILCTSSSTVELEDAESTLFGDVSESGSRPKETFELDSAMQGQAGLELVRRAHEELRPYAMAFVDVRMPPGWDGVETVDRIWREFPDLQIVICTAYSDYDWDAMVAKLNRIENLLILKKPFDNIEVRQLACALTEKWRLARQAHFKLDDLERLVKERTVELEQQKGDLHDALANLKRSQSQLLQSDKLASIGQLAAGVAHEINNPIGFISSNLNSLGEYTKSLKYVLAEYGELLKACDTGIDEIKTQATKVKQTESAVDLQYILSDLDSLIAESIEGANRVRQIVADLRDFSHVDSPDVSEEFVNELMDKTINVVWNELKYKAEVVRQYGEVPMIPCHGGKLGQVFLNLLVNASQAIKERGTVTVRSGQEGECVWVEVEDTGCGIPSEHLNNIFDPFFTTKEIGKGTGLGLHLAHTIVEAHGGRIVVRSEVGKGTTFRVYLSVAGPVSAEEVNHEQV
jgi:two-component system NtrC family sensor kinase